MVRTQGRPGAQATRHRRRLRPFPAFAHSPRRIGYFPRIPAHPRSLRAADDRTARRSLRTHASPTLTAAQAKAWLAARNREPTDKAVEQLLAASSIMGKVEFVPDPNEHIAQMGPLALKLFPLLVFRRWYVAAYSKPSLI